MYIQIGMSPIDANIGKVFLSKTGKTLTYESGELQSLKAMATKPITSTLKQVLNIGFPIHAKMEMTACITAQFILMKIYALNIGQQFGVCQNVKTKNLSNRAANTALDDKI